LPANIKHNIVISLTFYIFNFQIFNKDFLKDLFNINPAPHTFTTVLMFQIMTTKCNKRRPENLVGCLN